MKNSIYYLFFLACFILTSCDNEMLVEGEVQYEVTLTGKWTAAAFPQDYPSNDHFSSITGMSHNSDTSLYALGMLASAGIKKMAETGATSPLDSEVQSFIVAGDAHSFVDAGGVSKGGGDRTFTLTMSPDFPLVSLVTMIAPSPDWFAGISNVNLLVNDQWLSDLSIDAKTYDAGTDSGTSYKSSDVTTDPAKAIFLITEPPLGDGMGNNPVTASFRFRLLE